MQGESQYSVYTVYHFALHSKDFSRNKFSFYNIDAYIWCITKARATDLVTFCNHFWRQNNLIFLLGPPVQLTNVPFKNKKIIIYHEITGEGEN